MPRQLQPSRACVELVKTFEGLRPTAGRLETGGWTIGYGHTLTAREGARVSANDAEALLIYDLRHEAERIRPLLHTPLSQNEFDAVVAFTFNVGVDEFRASPVLKRLNGGDHLGAASIMERWRAAEFQGERLVIDGLVRRRAAEKALFLTPADGHAPVPTPVLRPMFDADGGDPVDARAGQAVRLVAALDGEPTLSRLEEAADSVGALLRERFRPLADEPAPFEARQASDAGPLEETEPYPGPESAALDPAEARSDTGADVTPDPSAEIGSDTGEAVTPADPAPLAESFPQPGIAYPSSETAAAPAPSRRAPALVGLVGLVMFCGAIMSMLSSRAGALNLLAGLIGSVCMAYAAANLSPSRSEPPRD